MDLKAIKTFHLIAKYESFVRAAEELNYSPSAVTMQMRKLESDPGVALIERGKPFRLTEAGRLFREKSLPLIRHMEQLQAIMADWESGEAGHIRLGAAEPAASHRLPALLNPFLQRHPNIQISVDIADAPALAERVLEGMSISRSVPRRKRTMSCTLRRCSRSRSRSCCRKAIRSRRRRPLTPAISAATGFSLRRRDVRTAGSSR